MRDTHVLQRAAARRVPHRRAQPSAETLEDRKLLYATLGGSFAYGSRITYSFVPDGTNIGGAPSALFQTMANRGFSTAQWQGAFQKAAAAWEAAANINLVLVSDSGAAFGASGNQQGDSRFGDIRIGGLPLSNGLATAFLPPPYNGGTLAGDIVVNDNAAWYINNDYDLQTVAIHEIGHALGLDHSSLSTSDMYAYYTGMKQTLSSDDIAGIQAVWGSRKQDAYDADSPNNTSSTSTDISSLLNPTTAQAAIGSLDITSSTDADWYVVTAPANTTGTLTVTMQSSNLSSLSPKVLLYNGALAGLASASAANTFGATVTVSVSGVTPGQKFYIKTMAANGGSTGIGSYGLLVNFGSQTMSPIGPPNTVVASQSDSNNKSLNDSFPVRRNQKHEHHVTHAHVRKTVPKGPVAMKAPAFHQTGGIN